MGNFLEQLQSQIILLVQSIASVLKIIIRSKIFVKIPKTTAERIIILGNGPSLSTVVEKYQDQLLSETLMAVNYFANSDYFEKLKPKYYLFVGPEFWRDNIREKSIQLRNQLFDNLETKTTWEMTMFIPFECTKSKFFKTRVKTIRHINFIAYNPTPVEGFQSFSHLLFRLNLGMPRPHNVIIPCLMIALNTGFKNIFLIGVEHSWLPGIFVDEKNQALFRNQHFYDKKNVQPHVMYRVGIRPRKLYEILEKFMLTFKGYFVILEYQNELKAKIYNCTPESFIDAFERKDFEKILTK